MTSEKSVILAYAPNSWDGPWMNRQQLLSRLANRGWEVLYSNGLRALASVRSGDWVGAQLFASTGYKNGVKVVTSGKIPLISKHWLQLSRRFQQGHTRRWGGDAQRLVLYIFHPSFVDYIPARGPQVVVYHAYDDFTPEDEQDRYGATLRAQEDKLLRRADVVLASSEAIRRKLCSRRLRAEIVLVPNGVDYASFAGLNIGAHAEPSELRAIPRPRVGYVGSINRKVDLQLVRGIALARPEWQWILVGAVSPKLSGDPGLRSALDHLLSLGNVHVLGHRPHEELPRYVAALDVATMCYRTSGGGWWANGYPLKMHEYLASGKPIVSSDLESVRPFSEVVDIREGLSDWLEGISLGLQDGSKAAIEQRRKVARENTWEKRVEVIERHIMACCEVRPSTTGGIECSS